MGRMRGQTSGLQLFSGLELNCLPLSPRPALVGVGSPRFRFHHSSSRLFQNLVTFLLGAARTKKQGKYGNRSLLGAPIAPARWRTALLSSGQCKEYVAELHNQGRIARVIQQNGKLHVQGYQVAQQIRYCRSPNFCLRLHCISL